MTFATFKALQKKSSVRVLDLTQNPLGSEGIGYLANALQQNTTLIELKVGHTDMYSEGAQSLANALKVNTTLTTLDMSHNISMDVSGFEFILAAFEQNITLTTCKGSYYSDDNIQKVLNKIAACCEENKKILEREDPSVVVNTKSKTPGVFTAPTLQDTLLFYVIKNTLKKSLPLPSACAAAMKRIARSLPS